MRRTSTASLMAVLLVVMPIADELELAPYPEAIEHIVRAERDGKWEDALQATETLLAEADARALTEYQRAEVHFAAGVVLAGRREVEEPEELKKALPPFEAARALAGPGELRLDAGYDLGVTELLRGERYRAQIPEIAGQPAAMAAPPAPPAAGDEEPKDPLEEARKAYFAAKERLLVRLRADWQDEDTRANLELIQRRLRELDDIEKRREEQQQPQQDPQQGDEGDEGDKGEQSENENQDGEPEEGDQKPEENEGGDESEQQDPSENGEENAEQETDPLETNASEEEQQPGEEGEQAAPAERRLTKEEVMRLLQNLEGIEERGEALQKILNNARREAVKRDW